MQPVINPKLQLGFILTVTNIYLLLQQQYICCCSLTGHGETSFSNDSDSGSESNKTYR
jgi:hypothetical protein